MLFKVFIENWKANLLCENNISFLFFRSASICILSFDVTQKKNNFFWKTKKKTILKTTNNYVYITCPLFKKNEFFP